MDTQEPDKGGPSPLHTPAKRSLVGDYSHDGWVFAAVLASVVLWAIAVWVANAPK